MLSLFLSLLKIVFYVFVILWGALALFAYKNINRTFSKYRKISELDAEKAQKWFGLIRTDFNYWNEKSILRGCLIRFPYKAMAVAGILVGQIFIIWWVNRWERVGRQLEKLFVKLYVKNVYRLIYRIEQENTVSKIETPIIISNHVCWFDIIYFVCKYYPISFVSKADVAQIPIVGAGAIFLQCLFLQRNSQSQRQAILQQINSRVQLYYSKPSQIHPLIIFPQGTTSNGKAILRFKQGAFFPKSKITIFSLNYQCQRFDMGMDEITVLEHFIISMSLKPHLKIRSSVIQNLQGQSVEQYMQRGRKELCQMSGFKKCECGNRQKEELKELRRKRD